jgi:hypothetical protein
MGVGIGVTIGATVRYNIPMLTEIGKIRDFDHCSYGLILQRTCIGLAYLVVQRFASKALIYLVIRLYYTLKNASTKDFTLKEKVQGNYKLELVYYIFCYGGIGFSAALTCFCLFEYLGFV